ncbi:hypothetical protein [Pediococcus damnosus]|nr:hypothetical protein [Pediococcus damnosus]AMV63132.1 Hypothetical protein ADU70_1654 [Pediococcus damnosus]AMV69421.1 Hypothetical protein ADU73_1017 [Pediococcus damnosus]KJU73776.1 hypothetical protein AH70_10760 [Pediococcus damnosus LMG 28219]KRN50059.1 hypothetical protein IV84_GL001320 [Pediococcus damnosus]PIO81173.1 hypothetical protein BSQ38_05665 [Pediococcus damnosus]
MIKPKYGSRAFSTFLYVIFILATICLFTVFNKNFGVIVATSDPVVDKITDTVNEKIPQYDGYTIKVTSNVIKPDLKTAVEQVYEGKEIKVDPTGFQNSVKQQLESDGISTLIINSSIGAGVQTKLTSEYQNAFQNQYLLQARELLPTYKGWTYLIMLVTFVLGTFFRIRYIHSKH